MSISKNDHRQGEDGNLPDRSERCFQEGQYWYYKTREKIKIGPFDDAQQASHGIDAFVEFICAEQQFSKTLAKYRQAA